MANHPFDFMYKPDLRDRAVFGPLYNPPMDFEHGKYHCVAKIPKTGGDGQACEIDECRMPARFFRLRVLAGTNSIGQPKPAYVVVTGSGDEMGEFLLKIAHEIARGMLDMKMGDGDDA